MNNGHSANESPYIQETHGKCFGSKQYMTLHQVKIGKNKCNNVQNQVQQQRLKLIRFLINSDLKLTIKMKYRNK